MHRMSPTAATVYLQSSQERRAVPAVTVVDFETKVFARDSETEYGYPNERGITMKIFLDTAKLLAIAMSSADRSTPHT